MQTWQPLDEPCEVVGNQLRAACASFKARQAEPNDYVALVLRVVDVLDDGIQHMPDDIREVIGEMPDYVRNSVRQSVAEKFAKPPRDTSDSDPSDAGTDAGGDPAPPG